jgi:hypothetical protein
MEDATKEMDWSSSSEYVLHREHNELISAKRCEVNPDPLANSLDVDQLVLVVNRHWRGDMKTLRMKHPMMMCLQH